jgi:hypothetical protein
MLNKDLIMKTAVGMHNTGNSSVMVDECYSLKEALKHGYTLEESKAQLTAIIRKHFHPELCESL